MKKLLLPTVSLCLAIAVISIASIKPTATKITENNAQTNTSDVIQVANKENSSVSSENVLKGRFLNMLNHSFAYGEDLYYLESIVNRSVLALLDLKEDSFIKEEYISDYVHNMYGIENIDFSLFGLDAPKLDGYFYVSPCGYETYSHEIVSITENEDGTFKVLTNLTIDAHDSVSYTTKCETLFVRNQSSHFGFNIIYSDIISDAMAI